ncbi:MAG: fibronectin type III domain-containing protein, partial [Bacillota bacterium]
MTNIFTRNKALIAFVVALMVFCLFIGIFTKGEKAEAANELTVDREINIAHVTDTHYYPLRYTHNDHDEGEFGRMMAGDTKILIEASTVVAAIFEDIYENGEDLDYLILSGDTTKDAEIGSHLDMANGLRFLQNRIREDYNNPNFQIFTLIGNHDIYNPHSYSFGGDGMQKDVRTVTRKDVSYIYAGLGYPEITYNEMMSDPYLHDLFTEDGVDENTFLPYEYDTERDTAFIESSNASNLDFYYLYEQRYSSSVDDYKEGDLSYIAINHDKSYAKFVIDSENSNEEIGHTAGGRIRQHVMDFYENHAINTIPESYTILGSTHRNILPHFSKQANILTQFIIEDWVNTVDFFADLGLRYVFTGHTHGLSIANHLSFNNNEIYDIETPGAVSFMGGVRYLTLESGMYGSNYAENLYSEFSMLKEIDFTNLFNDNYLNNDYIERNNLDQFMDGYVCTNFSEYAKYRIYENVIDNYMLKYVSEEFLYEIAETLQQFVPDSLAFISLENLKVMVDDIVLNLISEVEAKILDDYEYQGDNSAIEHRPFLAYAEDFVNRLRGVELDTEGHNFVDVFFHCYYTQLSGDTYNSVEEMPGWLRECLDNLASGEVVGEILDLLLNEEYGFYKLISGLLTEELDLTDNLTPTQVNQLNSIGKLIAGNDFDATKVNLDKLILRALPFVGMDDLIGDEESLHDFLDHMLEDYVTDSLKIGLGEIAEELMISFATDTVPNTNEEGEVLHIKINEEDEFTYTTVPREDNPTIENGKLPSMITSSFGENPQTDKNFVWFTDKRVNTTELKYCSNESMAGAITVSGDFDIYAHTYPQIDIGLFSTFGIDEIGRHSVELSGLQANTTYYYQVGSASFDYWSPVYKMTTAPDTDTPFDLLVIADAQGYTQKAYD